MDKIDVIRRLWQQNYEPAAGIASRVEYILSQFHVSDDVINDVLGEIYLADTKPFAISGAYEVMDMIMNHGSRLVIWTQGDPQYQHAKLSHFGLDQLMRVPELLVAVDKCQALETLENLVEHTSCVLIDDRSRFLANAQERLHTILKPKSNIHTVFVSQKEEEVGFAPTYQVDTVATLLDAQYHALFEEKTLVLLDFDRTLFDPEAFVDSVILPTLGEAVA